jgi:ABC-2 type transport system permease protein
VKILFIALKDIVILIKDQKSLISLIIAPLILTLILGISLNSLWAQGSSDNPLGTLLVVNNDLEGFFSEILINKVYLSEEFSSKIYVELIDDESQGKERVKQGKAAALVKIPLNFSKDIWEGNPTTIEILGDNGNEFLPPIILNVTETFIDEVSLRLVASQIATEYLTGSEIESEKINLFFQKIERTENKVRIAKDLRFIKTPDTTNPISATGYYSAAMAVMYLLFNANLGGKRILLEKEQGTWQRIKTTQISPLQFILGKTIGIYFSAILQMLVLISATSLIYGVKWGHPISVITFCLVVAFAASGIGIFIAALATSSTSADSLGTFIILVMSAIGGSMWPIYGMPPFMKFLSNFTFNRWALDGFTNIMFFNYPLNNLLNNILYLVIIGILSLSIATLVLSKRVVD